MADAVGGDRPRGFPSLDCSRRWQWRIISWVCLVAVFTILSQEAEGSVPFSEEEEPLWVVLNPVLPRRTGDKFHFMQFQDAASFVSLFVACQTARTPQDVLKCVEFAKGKIEAAFPGATSTDTKRRLRLVVQAPYYSIAWMMERSHLFAAIAMPYAYFEDCMTPIALDRRLTRCRGNATAMFDPGLLGEYYYRQVFGMEAKQGDVGLFTSFAEGLIEVPEAIEVVDSKTNEVLGAPGSKVYLWNGPAGLLLLSGSTAEKIAGSDSDGAALKAAEGINIGALGGTVHFKLKPDVVRAAMKMRRGQRSEFIHVVDDTAISLTQRSERVFKPFHEQPVKGKKLLYVLRISAEGPKWESKWESVLGSGTSLFHMRCKSRGNGGCNEDVPLLDRRDTYDFYAIGDNAEKLVNTVRRPGCGIVSLGEQSVAVQTKYLLAKEASDVRSPAFRNEAGVIQMSPGVVPFWNSYKKLNAAFYKVQNSACLEGFLMILDRRYWELETDNGEPFHWPADIDELAFKWDFLETAVLKNIQKRKKGTVFGRLAPPTWSSLTLKPKSGAPRKKGRVTFRCLRLPIHFEGTEVVLHRLPVDVRAAHSAFYRRNV